jgi:hypothetical protein
MNTRPLMQKACLCFFATCSGLVIGCYTESSPAAIVTKGSCSFDACKPSVNCSNSSRATTRTGISEKEAVKIATKHMENRIPEFHCQSASVSRMNDSENLFVLITFNKEVAGSFVLIEIEPKGKVVNVYPGK